MTVRASLGQLFVRNWPIKLAALFFAIMLYVAVAAQQPLSQTFVMRLAIAIPPGRTVRQQPAGVTVVIAGKGSEILKLRSFPRVIRKVIPDTFSTSLWRIQLQAADVELPKGIDVTVADIRPRDIEILLDSVAHKDVRIVPRVKVEAESGYVLRGLSITPSLARLVGPEKSLAKVESVTTLPTVITSVSGPFFQTVPIDTAPLGVVRISPKVVRMAGEVTWLPSFEASRHRATRRRPPCSSASAGAPSLPASSSCRRTCTRCSAGWCRSSRAGRTCPPCPRSWTARSPRPDSPGARWKRW